MAVGRLSGAWIRQVLASTYPEGVLRRSLLEHFAAILVTHRSSRGAKGRLAKRLYGTLLKLHRRGLILQEGGTIRAIGEPKKALESAPPALDAILERLLFKSLLAEDGQGDGHTPSTLKGARRAFLSRAIEAGWSLEDAASTLGVKAADAAQILREM